MFNKSRYCLLNIVYYNILCKHDWYSNGRNYVCNGSIIDYWLGTTKILLSNIMSTEIGPKLHIGL